MSKQEAKFELKITTIDHAHGFKIASVPDDSEQNEPGLFFPRRKIVGGRRRAKQRPSSLWHKARQMFKCCHTCGLGHRGMSVFAEPSLSQEFLPSRDDLSLPFIMAGKAAAQYGGGGGTSGGGSSSGNGNYVSPAREMA